LLDRDDKLKEAEKRIVEEIKKSEDYDSIKQELARLKANFDTSVRFYVLILLDFKAG